jgi:predicted patatin/cPLA2 family phospholipase
MKIAIIMSGGGMRAAYCVGALFELKEKGIIPDIIIAGSGSAGTASYYIAKQDKGIRIWTDLLSNKHFINFWRIKKILDIDYLIDEVFKKQEPLNILGVKKSIINYIIPATNIDTGEVEYFSSKDSDFDVFEIMRATMTYPVLYGKAICINSKKYMDGVFSASAYFHITKAKELGAEKIIIIDSGARKNKFLYKIYLYLKSRKFRKTQLEYLKMGKNAKNIIIIQPKNKIGGILNNKKEILRELIDQGRKLEGFKFN